MSLLDPKSVALIGASADEHKLGHFVLRNLLTGGFRGSIYAINPKHGEILGARAYGSIGDVPGPIDMAVVATPASTVTEIAGECGRKGVSTLVVISAGFSELGTDEGRSREEELVKTAHAYGMRLIGPNCLGFIRPPLKLNASFAENVQSSGAIALVSQSGALAVALLDLSPRLNIGYSLVASIGNKADIDECDLLELCEQDPHTAVIGLYLENIKDGARFIDVAGRVSEKKPIMLIKSGISRRGAKAVSSHTGALAGSLTALEAACVRAGVRRLQTTEEFLDALRLFSTQPPLLSRSVAIITNAGGPGVLATDAAERESLDVPALEKRTVAALARALPAASSTLNPVDVLGDALEDRYQAALSACAQDGGIDGIAVLLTPQVMTPATAIAQAIVAARRTHPLIPMVTSFMGQASVEQARAVLAEGGIPNFETPEQALHGLALLRRPARRRGQVDAAEEHDARSSAAHALLEKLNGPLDDALVSDLLALYDLPLPSQAIAQSDSEAVELAESIGYPVVAKVSSPNILHKTDIGGVRANLRTAEAVRTAFKEIMINARRHAPAAGVRGVLIQQFLPAGDEFIIGGLRDNVFGPLVMVGLGGIYTELFRDVRFRLAPVSEEEACAMLAELTSWKLLTGLRGKGQADITTLAKTVSTVSELLSDCPHIVELDLNPVIVRADGVAIADAKVIVKHAGARPRASP